MHPMKDKGKKRILIVDDHPMMREGLTMRIDREPDLVVSGEAGSAAEALEMLEQVKPHLVIVDITLPDRSGLELIKDILAMRPRVAILALSMHEESVYAERVLRAGARGYVMKQEGGRVIMEAIRTVLAGRVHASQALSARILDIFSGRRGTSDDSPVSALSDREFEVFQMIGQGMSTRDIAAKLRLSAKTIEAHRIHIKEKLRLRTASELVSFSARWSQR